MRVLRPLAVAAVAALLLLSGAGIGLFLSARYGPDQLAGLAERLLVPSLGPVEVGSVHFGFDWGPVLEVRGLRSRPVPDVAGAGLAAARVRVGLDLRGLLRGELRAGQVRVTGLRADLVRDAEGTLHPEAARRLLASARSSSDAARADRDSGLRGALDALRAAALPALSLDAASLTWRDLAAPRGDPLADLGLRGLDVSLRRSALAGSLALDASARLVSAGADQGGLELSAALPALGPPHADLAITGLDLSAAGPWLARWTRASEAELALGGRLGAHLAWRSDGEDGDRVEAELVGLDVRAEARLGPERKRQHVELPSARASATIVSTPRALAAEQVVLSLGPLRLAGDARLARPFGDRARIDFDLSGEPLEADTIRALLDASGAPIARRAAAALTGGRLTTWALRCSGARREEWPALASDPIGGWPPGCALDLAVEDAGAKLGAGPPLRALRGALHFARDRIELRGVRARLGDDPLPALDLGVSGVAAVVTALESGQIPAPVPPLPGWFTLEDWARGDREPGAPSRWQRADIEASRIAHPVLLRPISGLRAVLRPVPFGFDAEIADAWWGSARVQGRARKSGTPPGRIEVEATARSDGGPPPVDRADPAAWLRGGIRVELTKLGPFRAKGVEGRVRIEGDRGEISEGDAELVPRGRLVGEVDLRLGEREFVPADARLRVEGASLPDLLEDLSLGRDAMTGTAHLSGDLSAKLIPRENILRELTGPVTLKLREGEINKRMNLLLAIAAASDTFNPFRSRDVLPYEEIDGALALERGFVRAESLSLVGPAARLVGTGRVDVVEAPYRVEAVVGVFFFKTLDAVISKVPLVNRLLLGKDDNLVAAWFALEGPWVDPSARVLPQTLLTSGPMGIVTEGVPGFVRSGIESLQRLLGGGAPDVDAGPREAARRPPRRGARP